ncbi:YdhR family protein [Chelatococcus reniformis]|nr:YdhR family protein [Chelatococcus reniformis]
MPVLLIVSYVPSEAQEAIAAADRRASAERINALDGFRWKFWVREAAAGTRGGVYLFDSLEAARAWGEPTRERLSAAGGREVTIRYLDFDEALSAVNHAPF